MTKFNGTISILVSPFTQVSIPELQTKARNLSFLNFNKHVTKNLTFISGVVRHNIIIRCFISLKLFHLIITGRNWELLTIRLVFLSWFGYMYQYHPLLDTFSCTTIDCQPLSDFLPWDFFRLNFLLNTWLYSSHLHPSSWRLNGN